MEESSFIELKVLYAKDLGSFNYFQKLLVYTQVSIVSDDPDKKLEGNQLQRTPADKEEDKYPEWNHKMRFDLDESWIRDCDHLFLLFDLRHEGLYFGDKTIGEVRVPIKDLIDESNGVVRFVSYEVRTTDGKPNGVLNFSYKVNLKGSKISHGGGFPSATKIDGFSVVHHHNPSSGNLYPSLEEIQNPSPPGIQYPSPELPNPGHEIYSPPPPPPPPPQEIQYQPPEVHVEHISRETYYQPPPTPLPLLPLLHPPPHRPPMFHRPPHRPPFHRGFHHNHPPPVNPWAPDPNVFSGAGGYRGPSGPYEVFSNRETWLGGARDGHSPSWNGR